ncbi:hypothetical protein MUP77_23770 [Candidatus Bathyarchaeota archaeon]|nr:hypothetical protein [Candidatus Bathyarchaeota archaeon]
MAKANFLICFMGVDGSGKTSHAKLLLSFLKERGCSTKYVWAAGRPLFLYPFLLFTRILGYWSTIKEGAETDPLENAFGKTRKNLGAIYKALMFIDFLIVSLVKVRLPLFLKKTVICDRFSYDLLIELELSGLDSSFFEKLVLYMTYTPSIVFYANAPTKLIIQRRPEFTEENIRAKQQVFQKFAKHFCFKTIDSFESLDENQAYIRKETIAMMCHSK